jgi:hypothetical protein
MIMIFLREYFDVLFVGLVDGTFRVRDITFIYFNQGYYIHLLQLTFLKSRD